MTPKTVRLLRDIAIIIGYILLFALLTWFLFWAGMPYSTK